MALDGVRIILVEPAGPLNVGSVARVMKNMGLHQLWLVNCHCDPLGTEARQMAVHGVDILETAQQVTSLPAALTGCQRAIATTARIRSLPTPLESPRSALPWLLEGDEPSALIFGPEDRGLNNRELNYAQRFVCIPSSPDYPSLNLAQAVAICAYELYHTTLRATQGLETDTATQAQGNVETINGGLPSPAPMDSLETYYQDLETLLLKIGYLYPHTASARMTKFRRLFYRAMPTAEEVAMLRGMLRQTEWALQWQPRSANEHEEKLGERAETENS